MKMGIVGLPNVGKSTLFNALTDAGAGAANYPFCTIDPNVGVVAVPDNRLDFLTELYKPKKTTPATVEFLDIAGLVRGASRGEGLGNKFLGHIRSVDAIIHVVRCFDSTDITHVEGKTDPLRDISIVETELVLSDLEYLERQIDRLKVALKGDKTLKTKLDMLERLHEHLDKANSARTFETSSIVEEEYFSSLELLTRKPILYVANMDIDGFLNFSENPYFQSLLKHSEKERAEALPICAKLEEEIMALDEEDRKPFLEDMQLTEPGLYRVIRKSYALLGLISFFTAGETEVRAWTIRKGTRAPQAAGKIHSDFERGFIRAEIISYEDLYREGSVARAREKGHYRLEGKEYVMKDGDVTLFRFNV
ncbi:MAG: redox-regulated ATPase YchF [Eubacteriales bacterium]|jgi:GTP-binding protein YchF